MAKRRSSPGGTAVIRNRWERQLLRLRRDLARRERPGDPEEEEPLLGRVRFSF